MLRKSTILVIAFLAGGLMVIQAQANSDDIIVPGNSLAEKLAWLQRSADSHNTYIIEVKANENIEPHILEYKGAINITIVLRGDNTNRTIRLRSHGTMFTVRQDVKFILNKNITLQGHNGNGGAMVSVDGGTFIMNNESTITGNIRNMNQGGYQGGGVQINSGTFEMIGGTISGNTARNGGGVHVNGIFTMSGGTISGNTSRWGGGVVVQTGIFTMTGGTISGNSAVLGGGGVHVSGVDQNIFNMKGGMISGNTSNLCGGGVEISQPANFIKAGGTITGYNSDKVNGNVVKDENGNVLARKGHAVYVNENLRKETTAEQGTNLSARDSGRWD